MAAKRSTGSGGMTKAHKEALATVSDPLTPRLVTVEQGAML